MSIFYFGLNIIALSSGGIIQIEIQDLSHIVCILQSIIICTFSVVHHTQVWYPKFSPNQ